MSKPLKDWTGDDLREWREQHDWTQEETAIILGLKCQQRVQDMEGGRRAITNSVLIIIRHIEEGE